MEISRQGHSPLALFSWHNGVLNGVNNDLLPWILTCGKEEQAVFKLLAHLKLSMLSKRIILFTFNTKSPSPYQSCSCSHTLLPPHCHICQIYLPILSLTYHYLSNDSSYQSDRKLIKVMSNKFKMTFLYQSLCTMTFLHCQILPLTIKKLEKGNFQKTSEQDTGCNNIP